MGLANLVTPATMAVSLRRREGTHSLGRPDMPSPARASKSASLSAGRATSGRREPKPGAAVTMDDVARACGYSRATISLALRNDRTIPEATRERIAQRAQELGYRINPLVAALMSLQRKGRPSVGTTAGVAYLTFDEKENPWRKRSAYLSMFQGASVRANELGFRLEEFNLWSPGMIPSRMQEILYARNIHAAIVAPLPHRETTIDFDFSRLAVVGLGMSVHAPLIPRIANDHFQSAALAVNCCHALGYRRIGLVLNGEGSHRIEHRWLAGYRLGIEQNQLKASVPVLMPERSEDVAPAIPKWVEQHRPEVVILYSGEKELVRQIPRQVGWVSLGVERGDDETSGIFQNPELIGRLALEHAVSRLNTNGFGTLNESYLHVVAGRWLPGRTALGPGEVRPVAKPT